MGVILNKLYSCEEFKMGVILILNLTTNYIFEVGVMLIF